MTCMMTYRDILTALNHEESFGVLAGASTTEIVIYARNLDTSIGDLFLIPSDRGGERIYLFRMTEYANVLRRDGEMDPMAKNLLAMDDPFYSDDLETDKLIRLTGTLLGYAEETDEIWRFCPPRKLPAHLSPVYKIGFGEDRSIEEQEKCLAQLLLGQLGEGVFVGNLLAGERALEQVRVSIPGEYFAHHLGVFGRTGTGKSNILMVLINSILVNNRRLKGLLREKWGNRDRLVSLFAIDPHDEFARWKPGSRGGITRIAKTMGAQERQQLLEPFFYLSCRPQAALDADAELMGLAKQVVLHRRDIVPRDIISIMEFSDIMSAATEAIGDEHGEDWINAVLNGEIDVANEQIVHKSSLAGLNRRLSFLAGGRSILIPNNRAYTSTLAELVVSLERGRVLDVDTTLMTEVEQFILTTVVARTIFALRKAVKSATTIEEFLGDTEIPGEIDRHLPAQNSLKERLKELLEAKDSPYRDASGGLRKIIDLPSVNIIIEEAPSILNPARIRFGSVFRDISRQGRKFGVGLTVVSQQITEIDNGILSQLNTEISMALGNEDERRAAVQTASNDIFPFKRELQVMGTGQAILSASYKSVPLPVQIPEFK